MYSGFYYPFYRSYARPYLGYGYSPYAYGGPYSPYGSVYSSNIIGSAIANNSLINTGNAFGINQTATPTVIW